MSLLGIVGKSLSSAFSSTILLSLFIAKRDVTSRGKVLLPGE